MYQLLNIYIIIILLWIVRFYILTIIDDLDYNYSFMDTMFLYISNYRIFLFEFLHSRFCQENIFYFCIMLQLLNNYTIIYSLWILPFYSLTIIEYF